MKPGRLEFFISVWQRIRDVIERDQRLSRVFHGGASALLSRVVGLIVGAISLPLTIRYLGAEQYGIWVTVSTTVVLMAMLDLGIANSLTNMISRAYAEDDKAAAQRFYTSAFWSSCAISAALGLACWAVWKHIAWNTLFHLTDPNTALQAEVCVAIAVVFFLISLPLNLINRVLSGYQQTQVTNYANLLNSLLGLLAILAVLFTRGTLVELMLVYSAMMLVGTLGLNVWVVFQDKKWLLPSPTVISREALRELLGSGVGFFLLQLSALIVFNSDNLVIAHYLGPADVTPYSVTWRIAGYAAVMQAAVFPSLWPAYSEAYARGDYEWVRQVFWKMGRWAMAATVSAVLILGVFGRPMIGWYAGASAVPSQKLMAAICFWTVISTWMDLEACLLAATNRIRLQSVLALIAAGVNIVVSIYWVQRIGSLGVVLGTITSYCIVLIGPQTLIVWRVLYSPMHSDRGQRTTWWPEFLGLPLLWVLSTARLRAGMQLAKLLGLVPTRAQSGGRCERFLIVNLSAFLGDHVMTFPMIDRLRSARPHARISCAVPENFRGLMEQVPQVDSVLALKLPSTFPVGVRQSLARSWTVTREYWEKVRGEEFDVCILPRWRDDGFRARLLAYLTQAPERVGFLCESWTDRLPFRDSLLTTVDRGGQGLIEPARFVALTENAGFVAKEDLSQIPTQSSQILKSIAAGADWAELADRVGINMGSAFAVIAPGASKEFKRWPVERWSAVAEALIEGGYSIVVLSGPSDAAVARDLHDAIGRRGVLVAGATSVLESIALMSHAALFLGSDSGPGHIAGGLGIPTVILMVTTSEEDADSMYSASRIRPMGPHVWPILIERSVPPCGRSCSSQQQHCILSISTEHVFDCLRSICAQNRSEIENART